MPERAIPSTLNATLAFAMAAALLAQMLVMPLALGAHPSLMMAIIVILIPLNTPLWSLIHEAVHRNFHADTRVNEFAGRALSILFGACFDVLRFGHLMHHQYNRHWESEIYDPQTQNKCLAYAHHYFKMLGGLYLTEVATSFLIAISPLHFAQKMAQAYFSDERHRQAVLNSLLKTKTILRLRIDCALIIVFYAIICAIFAPHWYVLAALLLGRAVIISIMDNAYHYGTPADNSVIAKELKVPGWFARFILNFNFHETHHRNTGLSWADLQAQHEAQNIAYAKPLTGALLEQFKGPLKKA